MLSAAADAESTAGGLVYKKNNSRITITGYSGTSTTLTIPSAINGLPVAQIGEGAFNWCTGLTSVTIPDSVASIGEEAFLACKSLSRVTIGNGVASIGSAAFDGCISLTSVKIPKNVTSVGASAFYGCTGLTGVTISDGVVSIGSEAFYGCNSLASVMIPDSVTTIEGAVFYDCTSLTSVTIANSVTSIGGDAFNGCTSLASVTIPSSVTSIGSGAFGECTSLVSAVFMGDAPPSIGLGVFDWPAPDFTVYRVNNATGFNSWPWTLYTVVDVDIAVPPSVKTGATTANGYQASQLNGTVNPEGLQTIVCFQYGHSRSYGSASAGRNVGSGNGPVAFSAQIFNLMPATTYHYRIVATNSSGTTYGADRTFTTANPGLWGANDDGDLHGPVSRNSRGVPQTDQ